MMKPVRRLLQALGACALVMSAGAYAQPVKLINVFEVPAGQEQAALQSWERAREFLARQPGYRGTKLHQSLSPQSRFQLINIAEWESVRAFQDAVAAMEAARLAPLPQGVSASPALYRVVRD